MSHIRQTFEQQLNELHDGLFRIGTMVENALNLAIQCIKHYDPELSRRVIDDDQLINKEVQRLHENAVLLIARQQPMARDLRLISVVLSLLPELERMGDYAATICKVQRRIRNTENFISIGHLPQPIPRIINDIARHTSGILHAGLEALRTDDRTFAERVVDLDDQIDHLYRELFDVTVATTTSHPQLAASIIHLLTIAHNFERIGDRITNVAEQIEYLFTGKLVEINH